MGDAFVDLSLSLKNRLTHLLGDQTGILCFVFRKDLLEVTHFLESTTQTGVTLGILVAEALVRTVDVLLELVVADGLKGTVELVVFRVD